MVPKQVVLWDQVARRIAPGIKDLMLPCVSREYGLSHLAVTQAPVSGMGVRIPRHALCWSTVRTTVLERGVMTSITLSTGVPGTAVSRRDAGTLWLSASPFLKN